MNGRDLGAGNYILGHSDRELKRLNAQARLIDPITRRFFIEAGLVSGMRVLDVGSGAGDVTFLAAKLVGSTGEVVGVDRAASGIAAAQARAKALSISNVTFCEGDPTIMTFERPFDAVIGRYVLMFQKDPSTLLRRLATHLHPGGLVAFHESDYDGFRSIPTAPLYDQCCRWIVEALRGTDTNMGFNLPGTFINSGLPAPSMCLEALIGAGTTSVEPLELNVGLMRTLLPELERLGIATAAEVDIETLSLRLISEVTATGAVTVGRFEIGAWCRLP